ncbi:hypothetical protein GCM10025734_16840 [Kitasatospora paranensis]
MVTAVSLATAVWARAAGAPWQSVLFLALLAAQLGVVLGLRERLVTSANPFLPLAVAGSAGLALAALYLPVLQDVLLTEPLALPEIGAAALAGVVGFTAARVGGRGRILPAGRSDRVGPPRGAGG